MVYSAKMDRALSTIKTAMKEKWDETVGQWSEDINKWWMSDVAPWFTAENGKK